MDFQRGDYDGETLKLRQNKTDKSMLLACTEALKSALETAKADLGFSLHPRRHVLMRADGSAMGYHAMARVMVREHKRLGLMSYDQHALRYRGVMELAWAGCADDEIASLSGHTAKKMINKYVGEARQIMRARHAAAALPIIANQVLKTAQSAGTEVLKDIVSLIDTLMADEASNFSGSNAFRLAFAQNTFKINGDTDQATDRIGAVESARQFFHTPHEAAELFVSVARVYSAIGRIDLAKSSLGKMHEHTFGYWLRAKKEPQYDFWKWIYSKACEECPEIMEAGALSFAQFLLGMEETEDKGTAYRVYRCLIEGSSFSPAVTAGIVSRLLDSDLDLSRFDAAPLIAFTAAKETDYGTETDGRISPRCGADRAD